MSATLEVAANFSDFVDLSIPDPDSLNPEDMPIVLEAGANETYNTVFRGFITSARVSPAWDKLDKIILNIQCKDAFYRLEGRTINRRNPFSRGGRWAKITGVTKKSKSFDQPSGGRIASAGRSGRPDVHLSGSKPATARVIETPDIIDYSVTDPDKPITKLDLRMDPEVAYVTAGEGQNINVSLSEDNNTTIDYGNSVHSNTGDRMEFEDRWVIDPWAQIYATIEPDPDNEDDPRYAVVKINPNTFYPGINFGITFYSDEVENNQARKRRGRIVFQSIIPHTHESMIQGGPAFGTFS
jgi:hypothetical protein